MHIFDYSFLDEGVLPAELVNLTSTISALNALSEERRNRNISVYTELEKIARIQSVKGSNAIEGIVTTDARIKEIVEGNSTPLNHTEMEIVGYRNALDEIHTSHSQMVISEQTILHLHQVMTEAAGYEGSGRYKADDNIIAEVDEYGRRRVRFSPVPASQTADAMEQLLLAYVDARDNVRINNLLLIPCVILDFLCIHPFNDGNGRMSRLLTTLLLYRSGYVIGRYISLEIKIAKNKNLYYDALEQCQKGWNENTEDPTPFIKYLLQTILAAYRDFEDRVAMVDEKLPAIETVRRAVYHKIGKFTKSEAMELCPTLSKASIENAIKQLVEQGLLVRHGTGRSTFYTRSDAQ